jgi:hypothetical protein
MAIARPLGCSTPECTSPTPHTLPTPQPHDGAHSKHPPPIGKCASQLAYEACMRQVMASLAGRREWLAVSLCTPCVPKPQHFHCFVYASSTLRYRSRAPQLPSVSQPVCLAYRPRSPARPRQRYHPRPLQARRVPRAGVAALVARSSEVVQRPRPPASRRLTCGPQILDSINMMACECCATASILSLSTQIRHIASSPIPRPFILMHTDCFP